MPLTGSKPVPVKRRAWTVSWVGQVLLPQLPMEHACLMCLWILLKSTHCGFSAFCVHGTPTFLHLRVQQKNCGRHTFCIFCVQAHGPTPYQISLIKYKFKDVVVSDANLMRAEIGAARYVSVSKVLGSSTSGSQPS